MRKGWCAAFAATFLLCACSNLTPGDPQALLTQAKAKLDHTQTVHFHVDSDVSSIKASGAYLLGGDGDAKRPDQFVGQIFASISGLRVPANIVSLNGRFYVERPFSNHYEQANPGDYGFNDPATLISPTRGLSSLLVGDVNVKALDRYRYNGEQLDSVSATVAGTKLVPFIASANPNKSATVVFGMTTDIHELRQVQIHGLYFAGLNTPVDYTITLSDYGSPVSITPPA